MTDDTIITVDEDGYVTLPEEVADAGSKFIAERLDNDVVILTPVEMVEPGSADGYRVTQRLQAGYDDHGIVGILVKKTAL